MSKERELLKKILATRWLDHALSCEVEKLLAQPEQEPKIEFRGIRSNGDSYSPEQIEESPPYDMTIHDNPVAIKLEWYRRGYKQGFVDGQDVPHRKPDYFTDIILGVDYE